MKTVHRHRFLYLQHGREAHLQTLVLQGCKTRSAHGRLAACLKMGLGASTHMKKNPDSEGG